MAESSVRVALLARAGNARDQLRRALSELGAELVAEGDPAELDPVSVSNQSPTLIVVSLDSAIEVDLERFDSLLAEPGIEVIYDDAEVTRKLEGWDLNRWARHLAAKLVGNEALLPPLPVVDPIIEETITPPDIITNAIFGAVTLDASMAVPDTRLVNDGNTLLLSGFEFEVNPAHLGSSLHSGDTKRGDDNGARGLDFPLADFEQPNNTEQYSDYYDDNTQDNFIDSDVAALVAGLEGFERINSREDVRDLDFSIAFDAQHAAPSDINHLSESKEENTESASSSPMKFDFSNLALTEVEELAPTVLSSQTTTPIPLPDTMHLSLEPKDASPLVSNSGNVSSEVPKWEIDNLSSKSIYNNQAALLSQVTLTPQLVLPGALVILAGLGGPDSVRQLLANLPANLPVPVLLYQHLDMGKQERLVEQLAKVSRLPVMLAENGAMAQFGMVNVLSSEMTAIAEGQVLRFTAGTLLDLLVTLPPADSVVVMLSGAEVSLVPTVLSMEIRGTLVLAHDPESCIEPTAVKTLQRQGVHAYPIPGLSLQIAARWPQTPAGEN